MAEKQKCLWCDRTATRLCDATIGVEAIGARHDRDGKVGTLVTSVSAKHWTCDAPMCAHHAKRFGVVCMRGRGGSDTLDRCPWHVANPEPPMSHLVMFEREAEARRREVHAEVRRERMRANG